MTTICCDPTIAHHSCPRGCSADIECPVTIRFELQEVKPGEGSQAVKCFAHIDLQPVWDHVLILHGPDDPEGD